MTDTHSWTAHIKSVGEGDLDEVAIDAFLATMDAHGASITIGHGQLGATFSIGGIADHLDFTLEAAIEAVAVFRNAAETAGLPRWPIVRLEVITGDELNEDLTRPILPPLAGVREVAEILGVTKQRVDKLRSKEDFPMPVAQLAAGPIWNRHAIERFDEQWERRSGRPPKPITVENVKAATSVIYAYNGLMYDSYESLPDEAKQADSGDSPAPRPMTRTRQ